MEGHVYVCSWSKTTRGYKTWVKRRPRIFAEGTNFARAREKLWEEICRITGDGEAVTEFDPPPPDLVAPSIVRFDLVTVAGNSWARIANKDALYSAGTCGLCGMPRGDRTDIPVTLADVDSSCDGGIAVTQPIMSAHRDFFPAVYFYSERLLSLLTVTERSAIKWRAVARLGRARKAYFEAIHSHRTMPLVGRRDDGLSDRREVAWAVTCDSCGQNQVSKSNIVAEGTVLGPPPSIFTVGRRNEYLLGMTRERWSQLLDQPGTRDLASRPLTVIPDADVERTPVQQMVSAIRREEDAMIARHRAELASRARPN